MLILEAGSRRVKKVILDVVVPTLILNVKCEAFSVQSGLRRKLSSHQL